MAAVGFALLALAVHAPPIHAGVTHTKVTGTPRVAPSKAVLQQDQAGSPPAHGSHLHLPPLVLLSEVLLSVGLLLLIFFLIRFVPHLRPPRKRAPVPELDDLPPVTDRQLAEQVSVAFNEAFEGFRRGDHEASIIACWLRLEQLAESVGFSRQSQETSSELAARWSGVLPVDSRQLGELGELYREARFSNHRMSAEQVEQAQRALAGLRAGVAVVLSND